MIAATKPDLIFLDIQMPGMSGFDVLSSIGPDEMQMPATIFLTAYAEYALAALDIHALDYLLKPINEERFFSALERARELLALRKLAAQQQRISDLLSIETERKEGGPLGRLLVRERGRTFFVAVDDIEWIEAIGDYAGLHLKGRTHMVRESMAALESRLDPMKFARIHRSAIVRLDCIAALRARTNRDGMVQLKCGVELKVSRTYSLELRKALDRTGECLKRATDGPGENGTK